MFSFSTFVVFVFGAIPGVLTKCPYNGKSEIGTNLEAHSNLRRDLSKDMSNGGGRVPKGGFKAVLHDLKVLMKDSQAFWPADFLPPTGPNYGGLFIRLAWHCSGSYREHDGRGGCDGGRIRFNPELNWDDNANLDKALRLLQPIKKKYGDDLSWGDLIILSGNAAIDRMGGTTIGFCGGRIDDKDGGDSLKLGPSKEQEEIGPCLSIDKQGLCLSVNNTALGPTTVGLIYVNPGGPVGKEGNPRASATDIKTAFRRMGFNDTETVALIGGGHAFGKMHGACPKPPCGDGKGNNTFTSGYEGMWTSKPTTWSNEYFQNLFNFKWKSFTGPGGKLQFAPLAIESVKTPPMTMLTTDIAMLHGPYKDISREYARDLKLLEHDFAHAWYRLTTADMGPIERCIGDMIPPPQPFQATLPSPDDNLPDFIPVRASIQTIIDKESDYKEAFINLAYRCAATFQATNYKGGCNGARIRYSPENKWLENKGTEKALLALEPVKEMYPKVSYSDLIVLSGVVALEDMTDLSLPFCGGRVDADNAEISGPLKPRYYEPAVVQVRDDFQVKGLTMKQGVALSARKNLSSKYFKKLLKSDDSSSDFSREELALKEEYFMPYLIEFSEDQQSLYNEFASAWTYLMTADRFKDNYRNSCTGVNNPTL